MKKYNVAVVGATGLVGRTFLKVLAEYDFPINNLVLYASARSAGKKVLFKDKEYTIVELTHDAFDDIDIAFCQSVAYTSNNANFVLTNYS